MATVAMFVGRGKRLSGRRIEGRRLIAMPTGGGSVSESVRRFPIASSAARGKAIQVTHLPLTT